MAKLPKKDEVPVPVIPMPVIKPPTVVVEPLTGEELEAVKAAPEPKGTPVEVEPTIKPPLFPSTSGVSQETIAADLANTPVDQPHDPEAHAILPDPDVTRAAVIGSSEESTKPEPPILTHDQQAKLHDEGVEAAKPIDEQLKDHEVDKADLASDDKSRELVHETGEGREIQAPTEMADKTGDETIQVVTEMIEQESPEPSGDIPSARFKGEDRHGNPISGRRGHSEDAIRPDVELPGSNPVDPRSELRPYVGTRKDRPNELGLHVTQADICFHLNPSWRGGVCTKLGNKPCPYLGGHQQNCEIYQPKSA